MTKIGFVGASDKSDLVIYVSRILVELGKRVLLIDSTINQKTKYIVPTISRTPSYVTEYEGIDISVGFRNYSDIKSYLGMPESAVFSYDYIFIDLDDPSLIEVFDLYTASKNYFVTSPDLFDLKKGLEILSGIRIPLNLRKIWFSNSMLEEEDDYLDYLSLGYKINWDNEKLYFPMQSDDRDIIIENQRTSKIKFKGLSNEYKDALMTLTNDISGENIGQIKRAFRTLEKNV